MLYSLDLSYFKFRFAKLKLPVARFIAQYVLISRFSEKEK